MAKGHGHGEGDKGLSKGVKHGNLARGEHGRKQSFVTTPANFVGKPPSFKK